MWRGMRPPLGCGHRVSPNQVQKSALIGAEVHLWCMGAAGVSCIGCCAGAAITMPAPGCMPVARGTRAYCTIPGWGAMLAGCPCHCICGGALTG